MQGRLTDFFGPAVKRKVKKNVWNFFFYFFFFFFICREKKMENLLLRGKKGKKKSKGENQRGPAVRQKNQKKNKIFFSQFRKKKIQKKNSI